LVENLDPSAKILDGSPSIVYSSAPLSQVGRLDFLRKYYWRVVEYGLSDSTQGPIWMFISRVNHMHNVVFLDDFSDGSDNWTITNDGGSCIWEIHDVSEYSLPMNALGNVLAADADSCGEYTMTLTSATINIYNEMGNGIAFFEVEWDNDWRALITQDEAFVEVSIDSGKSWDIIWSATGGSVRNSHELVASNFGDISEEYLIKFRAIQPGWDWWWAIDNVQVKLVGILDSNLPPDHLYVEADTSQLLVNLNWDPGNFPSGPGGIYKLQRKIGLPTNIAEYLTIAELSSTTLEYIDQDVEENINYTYRIGSFTDEGSIWGNEATVYMEVINSVKVEQMPNAFSLEQNYPNPFNPSTIINYKIPERSSVVIKLFDLLGNEVATLVNEEKSIGSYEIVFDATGLPSGAYFYQLRAGYFVETKKMIFMK
jgi:hypothetical protein